MNPEGKPDRIAEIPRRVFVLAIRAYRVAVSPMIVALLGPRCRFTPTCSEYAVEAIERFGVVRGSAKAAMRLARCNPLGGHGYDPVARDHRVSAHAHP